METASRPEGQRGVVDTTSDIERMRRELQASRDRELALRNELAHRVRNILAITRSLFSRTVETAATLEHATDHFRGRLDALARYHGRTASTPDSEFDLEMMVSDELLTVTLATDTRVSVVGPTVLMRHTQAEVMGLALHELAINSIKFGVLADDQGQGRLRVRWSIEDSVLAFEWSETGISIVTPAPMRKGFGRQFIEQALPFQIGANSSFEVVPGGIIVRIDVPLSENSRADALEAAKDLS